MPAKFSLRYSLLCASLRADLARNARARGPAPRRTSVGPPGCGGLRQGDDRLCGRRQNGMFVPFGAPGRDH